MKEPLQTFNDLPNHYAQTNIAFSPDEQIFLTGTSVERDSTTGGLLCFYDRAKLELVSRVGISPTCSVVQCAWHPRLNQVLYIILFIDSISNKGKIKEYQTQMEIPSSVIIYLFFPLNISELPET